MSALNQHQTQGEATRMAYGIDQAKSTHTHLHTSRMNARTHVHTPTHLLIPTRLLIPTHLHTPTHTYSYPHAPTHTHTHLQTTTASSSPQTSVLRVNILYFVLKLILSSYLIYPGFLGGRCRTFAVTLSPSEGPSPSLCPGRRGLGIGPGCLL